MIVFPIHGSGRPGSGIPRRCIVSVGIEPNRSVNRTGTASAASRSSVTPPRVNTSAMGCYLLRAFLLTCWSCLVTSRAARHAALAWSLSCRSCCAILA